MSVSVFDPQTELATHRGSLIHFIEHTFRYLSLINYQNVDLEYVMKAGKVFVFNDAARHLAWNRTDTRRLIVMFDFIKPEFTHMKYRICASVLGGIAVQYLGQKINFIANGSNFVRRATFGLMKFVVLNYRPLQRGLGIFY